MGDETEAKSSTGAAQVQGQQGLEGQSASADNAEFLTVDHLTELLDERFQTLENRISERVSKSVKDSTRATVERAVRQRMADVEAEVNELPIDDDVKQKVLADKRKAIQAEEANKRIASLEEAKNNSPSQSVDTVAAAQKVHEANINVSQELGTWFVPADPENAMVTADPLRNPDQHIQQVRKALEAKVKRISQATNSSDGTQPTQPTAPHAPRNAGSVQGAPLGGDEALRRQFNQEMEALMNSPFSTSDQRVQLRAKYREKGLKI